MTGGAAGAAALCIVGAVTAVLLKQYCREQALFSSLAVCVIVVTAVLYSISPVIEKLEQLFLLTSLDRSWLTILLKATGICCITGIAADICRDSGEQALASAVELWGRVSLLILALPLIDSLLTLITGVLS